MNPAELLELLAGAAQHAEQLAAAQEWPARSGPARLATAAASA
jgi:hypothetical protein